jgi:SAM-dependent methyltransferase
MSGSFPAHYFGRQDEGADEVFYGEARPVVHLEEETLGSLRAFFGAAIPPGSRVLDLMSSWRSHLPEEVALEEVVGLGMNAAELAANPQLSQAVVHNLNTTPSLPFADQSFDVAVCTVSVQYLIKPVEVFREVARVLVPDAPFYVAISNRCFPSKATKIWLTTNDQQHIQLVGAYFQASGVFSEIQAEDHSPEVYRGEPLFVIWGRAHYQTL